MFSGPLVALLGATGAVRDYALLYLRISLFGVPATLVVLAGTGYLRGLQDTTTPLVVALVSAIANLVLELWLIFGLGFGLGASALATVLAQMGSAAVYVWWVRRAVRRHQVRLLPHGATLGRLAVVGRDLFVRTAALRGSLLVATAVATRLGTVALAAHQIAFEIWSFLALALDAVAIAGQALIGRYLGAGDVGSARRSGRRMLEWGVGAGVALGLITLALHTVVPRAVHRRSRGRRGVRLPPGVRGRDPAAERRWCSCSTACSSGPATCASWPGPWPCRSSPSSRARWPCSPWAAASAGCGPRWSCSWPCGS